MPNNLYTNHNPLPLTEALKNPQAFISKKKLSGDKHLSI